VGSVMERDVLCVAGRVSGMRLFMRSPGDHSRPERETIASNRPARDRAVCVVRAGVADRANGVVATKIKREQTSTLEIANNTYGSIPVFGSIAVKDSCQTPDSKSNVRAGGYCKVVEGANEGTIWCPLDPGGYS
jgi:hypothetical protein